MFRILNFLIFSNHLINMCMHVLCMYVYIFYIYIYTYISYLNNPLRKWIQWMQLEYLPYLLMVLGLILSMTKTSKPPNWERCLKRSTRLASPWCYLTELLKWQTSESTQFSILLKPALQDRRMSNKSLWGGRGRDLVGFASYSTWPRQGKTWV